LELWQGPALSGCAESLVDYARLDERRLAALESLFDAELQQGRAAVLVPELRRLVVENPHREKLAEQLMLALHGSGRTSEALEVYAAARRQLGIEPGGRLRELHQRLRGVVPAQLPHAREDFAGRRAELAVLDADLADWSGESVRIRVLSGEAGTGKTALALHWAHRVRKAFPDGQLYIDLGRTDPGVALAGVLRSLGIDRIPDRTDERAALFRSVLADRKFLLLLDNAVEADQVRPLLPGRSALVLVTSRVRLTGLVARDGARALPLHPRVWRGGHGVERQPERGHVAQIGVVLPHRGQLRRRQGLAEDPELVERTV
jgi:hypothetical protein